MDGFYELLSRAIIASIICEDSAQSVVAKLFAVFGSEILETHRRIRYLNQFSASCDIVVYPTRVIFSPYLYGLRTVKRSCNPSAVLRTVTSVAIDAV